MPPSLHVQLLGGFQLYFIGKPVTSLTSSRLQNLFAFLVLHRTAPISRQQLAALFWPETPESQARTNLRNLIHQLRQSFSFYDEFIASDALSLGWRKEASYTLDVVSFEDCLEGKSGTPLRREAFEKAIQIYTGDLLPECFDNWIVPIRERLRRAFLSALESLATITEEAREYPAALEYASRLVAADPLHASANYQLIRLHALLHDRSSAVKAYRIYSQHLSNELSAEPEAEVRELVNRLQHPGRQESIPKEMTALVGRKAEWHVMLAAWQRAQAGQAQLLIISGEAGVGKTRLVEELARWAALLGIQMLAACCYPAEGSLPYAPVVSWLRAQQLPRLEKVWLTELTRLLPEIRQTTSGLSRAEPIREAWQRQHLFEALAHALLARNQPRLMKQPGLPEQPKLLILEDIHWCDLDTLEWLHFLFRFAPHAPLLVIATLRSGEVVQEHPLMLLQAALRAEGKLVELKLQPLNKYETIQLANLIYRKTSGQSLDEEQAGEIYREAEGNPLFAIEMVRLGAIPPCPEPPCGDLLESSERVQSVLLRRLGQVRPNTREVTCLAATIGREFNLDVLREASRMDDEQLIPSIDELLQRQIIREISPDTYDFTHDLLRQAVFPGMSTAHQRMLHRKVAEAYLQLDKAALHPHDAEIANHYERAGLLPQAVQHYQMAAETAANIFANADAQRYLRRAVRLIDCSVVDKKHGLQPEEFSSLLERLADLLALDGRYSEAQNFYERALTQNSQAKNIWRSQVYRKISDARVPQYDHALAHKALDLAEAALGMRDEGDIPEVVQERLQVQLGRIQLFYWEGRPEKMEVLFQQIEAEIYARGRVDQQITLLSMQFMTRLRQERYRLSAETVEIARRRLILTESHSSRYEQAVAKFQVGFGLLWHGDITEARVCLTRALGATEQVGSRIWQIRSLAYLGIADRMLGNLDQVQEETQQMFELCSILNEHTYRGIGLSNLGWLAWRQGDFEKAGRLCSQANEVWNEFGGNAFHWLSNWVLLAIAVERRDFEGAATVSNAFIQPQPTDQHPMQPAADCLRQAFSTWQAGDTENTLVLYNQALEQARAAHEL